MTDSALLRRDESFAQTFCATVQRPGRTSQPKTRETPPLTNRTGQPRLHEAGRPHPTQSSITPGQETEAGPSSVGHDESFAQTFCATVQRPGRTSQPKTRETPPLTNRTGQPRLHEAGRPHPTQSSLTPGQETEAGPSSVGHDESFAQTFCATVQRPGRTSQPKTRETPPLTNRTGQPRLHEAGRPHPTQSSLTPGQETEAGPSSVGHDERKTWSDRDSTLLVSLRVKMEDSFHGTKAHKVLWNKIAKEMQSKGCLVTTDHCQNKWKSIKREYKQTVDHNSQTGANRKICKFYTELDELYGNNESTRPSMTLSSCSVPSTTGNLLDETEEPAEKVAKLPIGRKSRKPTKLPNVVDWLNEFHKEQRERDKRREEMVREHNRQKLDRFDRLLDILAKSKKED
ncbi:uncharacterized protein LOC119719731 isoform X2 [Patiria miniata]|uniref:Myb/SANT-like DNA-binding domain-containing protein n=1 Tax=Patiria miniata TaxID=46514 RepID=A0A913Z012_PATMI|nr:uncharacterized protein LOC119719731 isoform X2 [Patiria miniata]